MTGILHKRIASTWFLTVIVLFFICISLGILMRLAQGNEVKLIPGTFYSVMTVHGITMIGIWFVAGLAAVHYLLLRYVQVPAWSNLLAMVLTVVGVVLIWVSAFIGKFHAGWTFLYPLPLTYIGWEQWAATMFLAALAVLSLGWLIWCSAMLWAIFGRYGLKQAFAWQHLRGKPDVETPPFILITAVTLVGIVVCLITGLILVGLFFAEEFSGGAFVNDALLMKNLTYFFGHTVANEILYLGLAALYELLPTVMGRPRWKTTWYVSLAWNATMFFVLFAFFHHMYMDFVQPVGFQIVGQLASYFASLPAVAVSLFSVMVLIYRNPVRWNTTAVLFYLGVFGWVVGGVGAVIDSTISFNIMLHNTLWVPAHFHTYTVMGCVLLLLAFFNWLGYEFFGEQEPARTSKLNISLLLIGGFGFLLMFYLSGAFSVPRRFNAYPDELSMGTTLAVAGAIFATLYLVAMLLINVNIVKRCIKVFSYSPSAD